MNNRTLHLLGIARKAGRLEVGEEPVGAACRARQARLILVASDAASNSVRRVRHFAEAGSTLYVGVPFTKAELGGAVGRGSCAMLAVTDAGLAAALVKQLAEQDPERFAAARDQLSHRAEKVLQRQREQRAHEKNVREGKRKPWAAPKPAPQATHPAGTASRAEKQKRAPLPKGAYRIKGNQKPRSKPS